MAEAVASIQYLREKANAYAATFETPAGQKVLEDLYRNLNTQAPRMLLRIEYFLRIANGTIKLEGHKVNVKTEKDYMPDWPEEAA